MNKDSLNSSIFSFGTTNNNVFYIHSDVFKSMSNLQQKVRTISSQSCNNNIKNLCLQNPCNTTLVVYIDTSQPLMITPESIETKYYQNVLAFLTVELYSDHAEI
jgi:predicted glycosyltransferase involved in capsule biosynthesis